MDQLGGEVGELNQEDAILIRMVVEAVQFPQFLSLLNEHLAQAEEAGWASLVKAIREILDGERNRAKFDYLDDEDRKIAIGILRGLDNPSDIPDMKSSNTLFDPNAVLQNAQLLHQAGNLQEAAALYEQLLARFPQNPEFLTCLGTTTLQLGKFEASVQLLEQSLKISPNQPGTLINLGFGLIQLNRVVEALESFDHAIALKPDHAGAYSNRGNILIKLKRFDEALASFDRALALKPDYAEAHYNRGIVLGELKRFEEALASYGRALALKPDYAEAHYNRGIVLGILRRFEEALESYGRALALNPDYAEAYSKRGNALAALKRFDEALKNYDRALDFRKEIDFLNGFHLFTKMQLCNWHDVNALVTQIEEKIVSNKKATDPFSVLALISSAEIQRRAAEIFVSEICPPSLVLPNIQKYPEHKKVRIGYFSADFQNHPVMHLMAELFELHDHNKFELTAFSFGPDADDEWRKRAVESFDQFIDVRSLSDREVALLVRGMEIDIAVDLSGFTGSLRTGIFAERAAPIQVSYMGYPGTMGAEYIDYIIADPILIPEDKRQYYSEKIVYLPNSYQVNDRKQARSDEIFSRPEFGLPKTGFVFCCFNNNYKIHPEIFDVWMRLLHEVKGSVLWLSISNQTARNNLKSEAEKKGIDAGRLIFSEHMLRKEDHLVRIQLADLFLDTFPYNAHTTASDALRSGLPVLTYAGETFASRVAASLLNAVGLPELITNSLEAYEALALELATNPSRLVQIKEKLKSHLPTAPLFDTPLFTKHIEAAYADMYGRYQDDLAPEHIYVAP